MASDDHFNTIAALLRIGDLSEKNYYEAGQMQVRSKETAELTARLSHRPNRPQADS
jgi:hypothetical protein